MALFNALVEGVIDEAVVERLLASCGHDLHAVYGKAGVGFIRQNARRYNQAAPYISFLTLVDFMDTGVPCPPEVVSRWLPQRHVNMIFRVVVQEIESWLLADSTRIADFLRVSVRRVPTAPEQLADPKESC